MLSAEELAKLREKHDRRRRPDVHILLDDLEVLWTQNAELTRALMRVRDCECCQGKTLDAHTCDMVGIYKLLGSLPKIDG